MLRRSAPRNDGHYPAVIASGAKQSRSGKGMSLKRAPALAPLAFVLLCTGPAAAEEMTPEPTAVLQALDKITARVSRFDAPVGQAVRFGTLSIVVRDCEKSAPEDRPENAAFVQIDETRPKEQKSRLFSGWMFSSSPALSALEHPVYDVNLLECKPPPGVPATATPVAPPSPKSAGKSRGKTAR
jgi:hypothetical protein